MKREKWRNNLAVGFQGKGKSSWNQIPMVNTGRPQKPESSQGHILCMITQPGNDPQMASQHWSQGRREEMPSLGECGPCPSGKGTRREWLEGVPFWVPTLRGETSQEEGTEWAGCGGCLSVWLRSPLSLATTALRTYRWIGLFRWLPGSRKALEELGFKKKQIKIFFPLDHVSKCLHGLRKPIRI